MENILKGLQKGDYLKVNLKAKEVINEKINCYYRFGGICFYLYLGYYQFCSRYRNC